MGFVHFLELLLGLMIAILGVAKARIEYRIVKLKQRRERNANGAVHHNKPRS